MPEPQIAPDDLVDIDQEMASWLEKLYGKDNGYMAAAKLLDVMSLWIDFIADASQSGRCKKAFDCVMSNSVHQAAINLLREYTELKVQKQEKLSRNG